MNRTALVTGANRGIGFEVCRQLAKAGLQVIGTCRSEAIASETAAAFLAEGLTVRMEIADVSRQESIAALASRLQTSGITVDVLINNAGVFSDNGKTILDVDFPVFSETFAVNTLGPIEMSRVFFAGMMRQHWGRIVNVSSGMGQFESLDGWAAAYRLSKAGLNAATVMLADAGKAYGVLVNAVCPGWVKTQMGGSGATRDVAKGAETIVWLALQPNGSPTGKMWRDKKEISF